MDHIFCLVTLGHVLMTEANFRVILKKQCFVDLPPLLQDPFPKDHFRTTSATSTSQVLLICHVVNNSTGNKY